MTIQEQGTQQQGSRKLSMSFHRFSFSTSPFFFFSLSIPIPKSTLDVVETFLKIYLLKNLAFQSYTCHFIYPIHIHEFAEDNRNSFFFHNSKASNERSCNSQILSSLLKHITQTLPCDRVWY